MTFGIDHSGLSAGSGSSSYTSSAAPAIRPRAARRPAPPRPPCRRARRSGTCAVGFIAAKASASKIPARPRRQGAGVSTTWSASATAPCSSDRHRSSRSPRRRPAPCGRRPPPASPDRRGAPRDRAPDRPGPHDHVRRPASRSVCRCSHRARAGARACGGSLRPNASRIPITLLRDRVVEHATGVRHDDVALHELREQQALDPRRSTAGSTACAARQRPCGSQVVAVRPATCRRCRRSVIARSSGGAVGRVPQLDGLGGPRSPAAARRPSSP